MPDSHRSSLSAFVEERGDWLGRCAYLLTRDREAALDLLQDTLLLAWKSYDRVVGADNPERYVMRIMLNRHRSQYRRSKHYVVGLGYDDGASATTTSDPTGRVDDAQVVAAALTCLSPRQKAVVVLRYWADFDDQQIADALGCRRATVRSLAARGMHKLKQHLEPR